MPREARQARNEALFREVNQRIVELSENWAGGEFHIICECAAIGCQAMLPMRIEDYQRVRAYPRRFFIFPGHDFPEIEDIVEQHDTYQVVEKHADVQVDQFQADVETGRPLS
jgi:hypothetical protein